VYFEITFSQKKMHFSFYLYNFFQSMNKTKNKKIISPSSFFLLFEREEQFFFFLLKVDG